MDALGKGWFTEFGTMWPGQCISLEVEEVLLQEKSKYQDVLVFKSKNYGNVLVLDGAIQVTERDEFAYQEMISHLPLYSHEAPKKVLVVGGGDGGVLRECIKHPGVESVTLCELDEKVIEVSRKYLPGLNDGAYDHEKVKIVIEDGFKHLENNTAAYDIIITDSSDPVGPASSLFEKRYYELMRDALTPNGVLCTQGECMWLHLDLIKGIKEFCGSLFPVCEYGYCTIPTYPSGQIGFVLCSKNAKCSFSNPARAPTDADVAAMKLKYYNAAIHKAAFVLPEFARKVLN
jgi:spermidine synthase